MVSAEKIVALQDRLTRAWHVQPDAGVGGAAPGPENGTLDAEKMRDDWLQLVSLQHRANFDLWHIEDEARAPGASDAEVGRSKAAHRLDQSAAQRPDRRAGRQAYWPGSKRTGCRTPKRRCNSEPPGMIIDRLSILALKIYHTREEAERRGAPAGHAERNRERLAVLKEQRTDLAGCLDALWQETLNGRPALQTLPAAEDVQRPIVEPGDLREVSRQATRISAESRTPLTECGVLRIKMA